MTNENLSMNTSGRTAAKVRFQTKGMKRSVSNAQTNNAASSVKPFRRYSPQATQHSDRSLNSSGNSRRESPNVMLSRDDETNQMMMIKTSAEGYRRSGQKKSNYNQYFVEHSSSTPVNGHKRNHQNVRNGMPAGSVQYFLQPMEQNDLPYSGRTNSSTPPRYCVGPRRYTPPQISSTFFAGSKMDVAPSPAKLPPPPAHWLSSGASTCDPMLELTNEQRCVGLTSGLKILLKVQ